MIAVELPLEETRYHWYFSVTGAGFHVPGVAFNVRPTFADPEMRGVGVAVRRPDPTVPVRAEVFDTVGYPDFEPVTLTRMR